MTRPPRMPKHAHTTRAPRAPSAPHDVTCTLFAGVNPKVGSVQEGAWEQFVSEALPALIDNERRDKRRLPGYVLAPIDGKRDDAHTGAHTALAIDVDVLPDNDLGALQKRARKLACVVYETPSSTDEAPRVRVIAALAEPLPPELVLAARRALAEALGLDPAICGTDRAIAVSQVMFIGRLKGTRKRGMWAYEGDVWVPPRLTAPARKEVARSGGPTSPRRKSSEERLAGAFDFDSIPDLSAVSRCVPPAGQDGDRHSLVRALGGWLARRGFAPETVAEAVRRHIPSSDPDERARQALMAAQAVCAGSEAPGWDLLSQWAGQYGRGRRTLAALERACRDPREPMGFGEAAAETGEVWSEWWAQYLPRWTLARAASNLSGARRARSSHSAAAQAERRAENAEAIAELAPGLDGLETDDDGRPLGTVDNTIRCVRHFLGHSLAFDTTTSGAVLCERVRLDRGPGETLECGPWRDSYTTRTQAALNRLRMRHAYATDVRAAIVRVAEDRPLDILGDWLRGLADAWDGEPRVDDALARYWRADAGAIATAVSRVMLLSIAARGLEPGCQLDTVPVLIGAQGCGKTTSLQALVWGTSWRAPSGLGYGAERRFCGSRLEVGSKDAVASIRGHLVWALSELASVKRADIDEVKAWLTQRFDTFRPAYAHEDVRYARTAVFIGDLNPDKTGHVVVNRDATGGRRWLPVFVAPGFDYDDPTTYHLRIDVPALERDGAQILGEAARRVIDGEQHHPTDAEVEAIAPAVAAVSEDPIRDDPWFAPVRRWAKRRDKPFTITDVFALALDQPDTFKHGRAEALRLAGLLRELGYESRLSNGARRWVRT